MPFAKKRHYRALSTVDYDVLSNPLICDSLGANTDWLMLFEKVKQSNTGDNHLWHKWQAVASAELATRIVSFQRMQPNQLPDKSVNLEDNSRKSACHFGGKYAKCDRRECKCSNKCNILNITCGTYAHHSPKSKPTPSLLICTCNTALNFGQQIF